MPQPTLRLLPSVDRIVNAPSLSDVRSRQLLTDMAREALDDARRSISDGGAAPSFEELIADVRRRYEFVVRPPVQRVINATGVILHTNLGRAPLAVEAIEAMAVVSRGYSNLEFEMGSGARGSRHTILEPLLRRLTGAEAAMAVNNNASAVLLALAALAAGKEVVVSRGHLVEIGGGFRVPDVMRQSRARLVEVGTTNRTRAADFASAVGPKTAAVMRVHPSNFKVSGFTEAPSLENVARVAREADVLLLDDLGSGCLLDTRAYGLPPEPTAQASIAAGADVVTFSGDKLLGGPQAGLIVGTAKAVAAMKRHPLARAVRLDKASIAGMAATLRLYLEGAAEARIPVWRMISTTIDDLDERARALASRIGAAAKVADGRSMIGGGSLPEESLPTRLVAIEPGRCSATSLARRLRARDVVPRIEDGRLLIDPRTVDPGDDAQVAAAVVAALA
jgi:L-seryl-tRNA(Ser) seleniumtransferase